MTFWQLAGLTAAGGMRSQLPLAILAHAVDDGTLDRDLRVPARWLSIRGVRGLLTLSAIGEAIGDKSSLAPSRMRPGPLGGRVVFGMVAVTIIARTHHLPLAPALAIGAMGSLAGSVAGYAFRTNLAQRFGLPDPALAVIEDMSALALALRCGPHR